MSLGNVDLTRELVQAVRDAVDVLDVASQHTRLTKKGRRHEGLCPLHKEKTPSFSVDPERGLFYCFGCGSGGDAIKLHMLLSGDDFPAAVESLALRYGIPLTSRSARRGGRQGDEGPDLEGALTVAAEFFVDQLERSPAARDYLEKRRIPRQLVERYGLGYAPDDWHALERALGRKVPLAALLAAGLVGRSKTRDEPYDRFRHRLMFPIHNASGRLVGFGGRTLGDDPAKYVNTSETDRFHKGTLLYGLHQARRPIRETGRAVLVEGYFDVLGAAASGVEGVVASMGTSLTDGQARLVARWAEEVVVAYDGDRAGEEAHRRALPILLGRGLAVYRARFGEGHDPDSLRLAEGEEAVARAIDRAPDAVLAEIERLTPAGVADEPRRQAAAASQLAALLAPIPDPVLRLGYGRRAGQRLEVPPEMLLKRAAGGPEGRGAGAPAVRELPASAAARRPAGPGRDAEEAFLRYLLSGGELPALAELPGEEVFLDPASRNIYRAFCALYERRGGVPDSKQLVAELSGDEEAVDRIAKLLLEEPFASDPGGFRDPQDSLVRRWRKRRLVELSREIHEAQRAGDSARSQRLAHEMTELSRRRHDAPARDGE